MWFLNFLIIPPCSANKNICLYPRLYTLCRWIILLKCDEGYSKWHKYHTCFEFGRSLRLWVVDTVPLRVWVVSITCYDVHIHTSVFFTPLCVKKKYTGHFRKYGTLHIVHLLYAVFCKRKFKIYNFFIGFKYCCIINIVAERHTVVMQRCRVSIFI